ncbi:hydroxy-delta-5-steroid dehydrogenase, 3 beta- and steroid delta-isomerase 1 [Lampris incognitus]|uniref:hydroxy-delta-5-steroid dehydrogenase, 3 beta- and steroid delta-isomerase 1 n=1 Tax=Lampris incognitus TaxID=2546036 RepID=UPI0024B5278F|nr:hydroxy-delta-5-steroid dehydrogenase, 3 beta- and steroid delta-isomerase 1 [Lampris incognitus]
MSLRGEVCVVTGACGFLGRKLVRLLLDEETLAEIRLLDRYEPPVEFLQGLKDCQRKTVVSVYEGDIRDSEFLRKACRGASMVFHVASVIDTHGNLEDSELYDINVKGTKLLLEACIQENVTSFIYTSSLEVMGPNSNGDPIINGNEDTKYNTFGLFTYGNTKKEAERISLKANGEVLQNGGLLATCTLRPMYIYGDGCRFLLYHMTRGIQNNDVLYRVSAPEALVNPVYIGNVVQAHLQAGRALKDPLKRTNVGGKFYYVCDDTPHMSYSDFNYAIMSSLGFSIQKKLAMPYTLLYLYCLFWEMLRFLLHPFIKIHVPITRKLLVLMNTPFSFSYQKAQRDLGYAPRYTWEEARTHTIEWLATKLPKEREKIRSK